MSAVATPERAPAAARRIKLTSGPGPFDDRATLESVILSAWEGAVVEGSCACPVCASPMIAAGHSATCSGCGSELS